VFIGRRGALAFAVVVALFSSGCGGSSNSNLNSAPASALSGSWEFTVTSRSTGVGVPMKRLIEANLAEYRGQFLVPDGQLPELFSLEPNGSYSLGFACNGRPYPSLSANLAGNSSQIQLKFSSGARLSANADLNPDGTLSGTYTGGCPSSDEGTFTGRRPGAAASTYNGSFPNSLGVEYPISLTLTENTDTTLNVSGTYEAQAITLSGFAMGSAISFSGSVGGQSMAMVGYLPGDGTLQIWNQSNQAYLATLQRQ